MLPHLSHRREIHLLKRGAPDADFVIAAAHLDPWPNKTRDEIYALIEERKRRGYVVQFESDGWIVLRAPAPPECWLAHYEISIVSVDLLRSVNA